jgi:hypothetical protein
LLNSRADKLKTRTLATRTLKLAKKLLSIELPAT